MCSSLEISWLLGRLLKDGRAILFPSTESIEESGENVGDWGEYREQEGFRRHGTALTAPRRRSGAKSFKFVPQLQQDPRGRDGLTRTEEG